MGCCPAGLKGPRGITTITGLLSVPAHARRGPPLSGSKWAWVACEYCQAGQVTRRASRSLAPSRHQYHRGSALNGCSRPSHQARSALPHPRDQDYPPAGANISFRRPPPSGILQSDRRMAGDPMRAALSSTTWVRRPANSSTISFFWPASGQPGNIEGRLDSVKRNVAIVPTLASGGRDHCLSAVALPTLREAVGASIKYRDG